MRYPTAAGRPARATRRFPGGLRRGPTLGAQSLCAGSGRVGLVQHRDLEAALVPLDRAAAPDADPAEHAAQVRGRYAGLMGSVMAQSSENLELNQ